MRGERLKHTLRLWTLRNSGQRMEYMKAHHIFRSVGEHSTFMGRVVPLYSNLIKIGSNVRISSQVSFVAHDTIHKMLNRKYENDGLTFEEKVGCIEVGDNVFIGTGVKILYNVRIGSNVVIGSGSLVNRDIPDNSIVAGIPARVVGSFDDFVQKRLTGTQYPEGMRPGGESVSEEMADWCWEQFYRKRDERAVNK